MWEAQPAERLAAGREEAGEFISPRKFGESSNFWMERSARMVVLMFQGCAVGLTTCEQSQSELWPSIQHGCCVGRRCKTVRFYGAVSPMSIHAHVDVVAGGLGRDVDRFR
eukprot:288741-Prorocentrum_minimum.AAC.1